MHRERHDTSRILPSLHRAVRMRVDPAIWPQTVAGGRRRQAVRRRGGAHRGRRRVRHAGLCSRRGRLPLSRAAGTARRCPTPRSSTRASRCSPRALPAGLTEEGLGVDVCSAGELADRPRRWRRPARHRRARQREDRTTSSPTPPTSASAASWSTPKSKSPTWPDSSNDRSACWCGSPPSVDIHGHAAVTTGVARPEVRVHPDRRTRRPRGAAHPRPADAGARRPALPPRLTGHRRRRATARRCAEWSARWPTYGPTRRDAARAEHRWRSWRSLRRR